MPTRGKDLYLLAKQTAAAESIQSVQGGNTTSDDRQINWHETRKSGGILVSATFQRFHPISTLVCLDCCLIKIVDVFGDLATWMEGKVFHAALRVVGLQQNRRLRRLWILMRRAIIASDWCWELSNTDPRHAPSTHRTAHSLATSVHPESESESAIDLAQCGYRYERSACTAACYRVPS